MLSKLLESGIGHVGFLLIGVNDGQLQILSITGEVRFQFEHLAVGGNRFIIAASHIKYVAASIEGVGIARANCHVGVIGGQSAIDIARLGEFVGLKIEQIFILGIERQSLLQ